MLEYKRVDRRGKLCTADRMVDGIVGSVVQVTKKISLKSQLENMQSGWHVL